MSEIFKLSSQSDAFDVSFENLTELYYNTLRKLPKGEAGRYWLFSFYSKLRDCYEGVTPRLGSIEGYKRDLLEAERVKFAEKPCCMLPCYMLTYRNVDWPVYQEEGSFESYAQSPDGAIYSLAWDWWYPIDEALDMTL